MKLRAKLLVPVGIAGAGLAGAVVLVATRPGLEIAPQERVAPLVRVIDVAPSAVQLRVRTHGTVAPRTESDLIPEVSGPVVWVSPSLASGGFFEADEPLLRVDARDYAVAVERASAQLARARSEHERASKERERRSGLKQRDFASSSQLDDAVNAEQVARATLRDARAALEKAERDLARTTLRAPYRGRVREESVDVGQFVTRGAPIARLYATDYAEVRLPIADEELAFLDLPLWSDAAAEVEGPAVRLTARFAGAEHVWSGHVVRTEGEIDPNSRMVHVIARIDDPYARDVDSDRPPLAVGLFVEAEILGRRLERALVLPRLALQGADEILVVGADDRLHVRRVDVLRADRERAILRSGLAPGERVVVSAPPVVIDGMPVRTLAAEAQETPGAQASDEPLRQTPRKADG